MAKKILIIDDQAEIREMYESVLRAKNYDVHSKENGLTGAMHAVEFEPDLILLDIMMPQMDGFAVLNAINQSEKLYCKIIVISNLDDKETIQKALDRGAIKYMIKSEYTPDEVVDEIEKIFAEEKNV